jgi:DNA mismatch repair protein MutS
MGNVIRLSDWKQNLEGQLTEMAKKSTIYAQYASIKKRHPKTIIFYRIGDFYEVFLDDAVTVSRILNTPLSRTRPPIKIGIQFHDGEEKMKMVVKAGYRVAKCEKLGDPYSTDDSSHIVTRITYS